MSRKAAWPDCATTGAASATSPGLLPARLPVVSEFQSDAMEIEQRKPPRLARITLYCVVALILAATLWATVSHVDMIVTAQGKLITTRPNMVVQPLETSVIREIHVRAGDVVNRGDVLATLDPTFSQADLDQLHDRVSALDAAINRLNAELSGQDYTVTNPSDPDEILQDKLFKQRKSFNAAQLSNFDAQIASARANLETSRNEESVLKQRLETMNSIESMRSTLMDQKVGSRLNFLLSRDARLDVESNLSRTRGSQVDYAHRVEKVSADRQVFIEDFRKQASQDLVETVAKRNSAAEDLKKAELRRKLIVLTAPADAIVLEIANRTVGSVTREAETLFVLVPRDVPLQAEVDVEGRDIGQVAVGQPVRIKYEAYPFQKVRNRLRYGSCGQPRCLCAGCQERADTPTPGAVLSSSGRCRRHQTATAAGAHAVASGYGRHGGTQGRQPSRDFLLPLPAAPWAGRKYP